MQLSRQSFGQLDDRTAELFTFYDPVSGFSVSISDFGATLVRVKVPDRTGKVEDISFGHNSVDEYALNSGYFGGLVGRTISRIVNGKFTLDGQEYHLTLNNNGHHKHGGEKSFAHKFWKVKDVSVAEYTGRLCLEYFSKDGEEGYPGNLRTQIDFFITPNSIEWELKATTDKSTIVNLTNHAYWNLDGLTTTVDNLCLSVNASKVMEYNSSGSPTGELKSVIDTALDLHSPKFLYSLFDSVGDLDHVFPLDGYAQKHTFRDLFLAAELASKISGRKMRVFTTEPYLIVYSGNYMGKIPTFNHECVKHNGICLETIRPPNAINFPSMASLVILRPDSEYYAKTKIEFLIEK